MRILLDEDLPRRLGALLVGHEVSTVQRSGWSGIKNGKLLVLAASRFAERISHDGRKPRVSTESRNPAHCRTRGGSSEQSNRAPGATCAQHSAGTQSFPAKVASTSRRLTRPR